MEEIKLYEKKLYDGCEKVTLEIYLHRPSKELSARPKRAMLVLPGGGYAFTSDREAEPISSAYYAQNYNCFVLRYAVAENAKVNHPLYDVATAIAHIRQNAEKYNIDPDKITVIGFSAGGHLAAYIAVKWYDKQLAEFVGFSNEQIKPNAAILGYPVISDRQRTHNESFDNLLGKDRSRELSDKACVELFVDEQTCPCYIWSTVPDSCVPVENSITFANALADKKVPFELHIFPMGDHGLSRANDETTPDWAGRTYDIPYVARWVEWSYKFLDWVYSAK